ncbi:M48 family metallopeptidase [Thalassobaculum sp.]|uniref:M48 family metallopeptidase n=1 Tax=Thalassobaculum sp. TaxID=2022740 RepID=UPI0032ECD098
MPVPPMLSSLVPSRRLSAALVLCGMVAACTNAPVTGRQQLILLPEGQAQQMGVEAYQQIKSEKGVSNDPRYTGPVQEIGRRVAAVSGQPDLAWEFTVFEDEEPNAFALPGGKVGVNTGLFKVAKTKDQLAAVMAHEVGHAIARHSAERVSRQALVQAGQQAIGAQYPGMAEVLAQASTLGLILPFTRSQESEADHIGLMLMARAGYDPRAAVDLWRNFEAAGGGRPPEFLSTHPAPGSRIDNLNAIMPQALDEYQRSPHRQG